MKNKEYSRSTDISNTREIYNGLSESNQLIMDAAFNLLVILLQNIQSLQNSPVDQTKKKTL